MIEKFEKVMDIEVWGGYEFQILCDLEWFSKIQSHTYITDSLSYLESHKGVYVLYTYINDLPDHLQHSITLMFADDTKCIKYRLHSAIQDIYRATMELLA